MMKKLKKIFTYDTGVGPVYLIITCFLECIDIIILFLMKYVKNEIGTFFAIIVLGIFLIIITIPLYYESHK